MYSDLLFLENNLGDYLTKSYIEFKKKIHDKFPIIFDIKVLSKAIKKSFLSLEELCKNLEAEKKIVLEDRI